MSSHQDKARVIVISAGQATGEQSSLVAFIATALSEAEKAGERKGMEKAAKVADGLDPNATDIAAAIRQMIEADNG